MATDKDTVIISSPRDDDIVNISNADSRYPDDSFSIRDTIDIAPHDLWLDYLNDDSVVSLIYGSQGRWTNYVKSAVIRAQFDNEMPIYGIDIVAGGTISVAAGLSSSLSIVDVMEALIASMLRI